LVRKARLSSQLSEEQALAIAVEEVRAVRQAA